MSLPHPIRRVTLCYVTDRKVLPGSADEQVPALLDKIENAGRAGVDWIQIREKDLSGRALAALVQAALSRVPRSCRILVNDRLDVAIAAGAAGAHFGETSLPVEEAKRLLKEQAGADFLVGASRHSLAFALDAERRGADYLIFGPVFETPSKKRFGPPQGLERLAELCTRVAIPVMAIGGITEENAKQCLAAGASGIAAIRLFQDASDLPALMARLRG